MRESLAEARHLGLHVLGCLFELNTGDAKSGWDCSRAAHHLCPCCGRQVCNPHWDGEVRACVDCASATRTQFCLIFGSLHQGHVLTLRDRAPMVANCECGAAFIAGAMPDSPPTWSENSHRNADILARDARLSGAYEWARYF
jgi:hypothetical protein